MTILRKDTIRPTGRVPAAGQLIGSWPRPKLYPMRRPPASMIVPGETGFHFQPGNAAELRERVEWCSSHLAELRAMRSKAKQAFEANYTGAANAKILLAAYRLAKRAVAGRKASHGHQ